MALALQADGWWLRRDIIWSKPNPMPESCRDRPTSAHEYVFLLTKAARYYYDADAIREPLETHEKRTSRIVYDGKSVATSTFLPPNPAGRNKRSVWTIATQAFPEAHFATFPEKLVEPCILAGSSPKACGVCGAPWERVVESEIEPQYASRHGGYAARGNSDGMVDMSQTWTPGTKRVTTTGWRPTCAHTDDSARCLVLDPFAGSGTVGLVCKRWGRDFVGIELSEEYVQMAKKRTSKAVTVRMF